MEKQVFNRQLSKHGLQRKHLSIFEQIGNMTKMTASHRWNFLGQKWKKSSFFRGKNFKNGSKSKFYVLFLQKKFNFFEKIF